MIIFLEEQKFPLMSSLGSVFDNTYGLKESDIGEIYQSCRQCDVCNNGYITRDELKQCFRRANLISLGDIVDPVLQRNGLNHDGKVNYDEYIKLIITIYRNEQNDLKRLVGNANDNVGSAIDFLECILSKTI